MWLAFSCFSTDKVGATRTLPLPMQSADGSDQCVTLEDCYTAAKLNNLTYFGIVDQIYCFGGSDLRTVEDDWVDSS